MVKRNREAELPYPSWKWRWKIASGRAAIVPHAKRTIGDDSVELRGVGKAVALLRFEPPITPTFCFRRNLLGYSTTASLDRVAVDHTPIREFR